MSKRGRDDGGGAPRARHHVVRRIALRGLAVLLAVVVVLVVLIAATAQGRTAFRTLLFVSQVLPGIPLKPQTWFTREPVYQQIEFPAAKGMAAADLYLPAGSGRHSAVVFFMGVVPPERDERRIVRLAYGLARAGIVVMIPWLDSQNMNRLSTGDVDSLVRAFQYLRTLDSVDPERVGMGGICTGASLVTVAAQDHRIADDVRFISFFAGYYDAVDLLKAIGSRSRFYGEDVRPWRPDSLTMDLLTYHLIENAGDPDDRRLLASLLIDDEPVSEGSLRMLSPEGTAVYRLVTGAPFDEVDGLVALLSPETMDFLRLISPSTGIDKLKARVLIMHDRTDRLVPSEESRRFADALGDDSDTYYTEFSSFSQGVEVHVDEDRGTNPLSYAREAFKLFLHMYNVMREIS